MTPEGRLPAEARAAWEELANAARPAGVFDPAALAGLPEPVSRWLARTVPPGAPLPGAARLLMHGEIKLGRWQPFTAQEILTPAGFVWAATAGHRPLRVTGFDRYSGQTGEMRWKLFGLIPVMTASGPDVTRSAAGRLAGEALLLPGAALAANVAWRAGDDRRAVAAVTNGPFTHEVTVEVDEDGALQSATVTRWGNPDRGPYAEHGFRVELSEDRVFDGYRMPTRWRAGWSGAAEPSAPGEFFRAVIDHAELR